LQTEPECRKARPTAMMNFPGGPGFPGAQVQQLVLAIAGVRWPYTPDVLPPFHAGTAS
jgi:hypothetical protein